MDDYIGQTYAPKLMVDEALAFLRAHKDQPFFLYLAFIEPHVAMHPPKEAVDEYPVEWDKKPYRGECGYLPHPRPRAAYAAMVSDLDRHVGAVLDELKALGLDQNTLVVFTSDNGTTHAGNQASPFFIGGTDPRFFRSEAGLRGFKGSVYEGGIRVPAIVRWPGRVKPGTTSDAPGYFADWFPTLCAAAGLDAPAGLDGINLLPVLTGEGAPSARNPMVWVFPGYGGQMAVNFGRYKVLRRQLNTRTPGPWEVYDIERDPGEAHNLAAGQPDLVRKTVEVLSAQVAGNTTFPMAVPEASSAP